MTPSVEKHGAEKGGIGGGGDARVKKEGCLQDEEEGSTEGGGDDDDDEIARFFTELPPRPKHAKREGAVVMIVVSDSSDGDADAPPYRAVVLLNHPLASLAIREGWRRV